MIGLRIRKLRKHEGMTQAELAEKLDVCRQTVIKWEKGITEPDAESIRAAAALFRVSVSELLDSYADDGGILERLHTYIPVLGDSGPRAVSGYVIDSGKREGIPHAEVEVVAGGRCITKMTADGRGFFIGSTGSVRQYSVRFTVPGMTYEIPKIRSVEGETYLGGIDLAEMTEIAIPAQGTWGGNIAWQIDGDGVLTLIGRGDMEDRYSLFSGKRERSPWRCLVKKVVIRSGITSVGAHAFDGFIHLEEVRIGKSVERIRTGAFMGCKKLKTVSLSGDALTEIDWNAFRGCVSLTRVSLPASVKTIGTGAFAGCVSLGSVSGTADAEISADAFDFCGNLKAEETDRQ